MSECVCVCEREYVCACMSVVGLHVFFVSE